VECTLEVGQSIEHLDGALAVADVEDFVYAGLLLDHADVGGVVVKTHISPSVKPELIVVLGTQCFVHL